MTSQRAILCLAFFLSSACAAEPGVALDALACAPSCMPADPSTLPAGMDPETTCYDGCNWCTCTAEGPVSCTARFCTTVDAGAITDAASGGALPAAECAPSCVPADPSTLPAGMDPETTCYDGCNWCTCTAEGPVSCTARACGDAG